MLLDLKERIADREIEIGIEEYESRYDELPEDFCRE